MLVRPRLIGVVAVAVAVAAVACGGDDGGSGSSGGGLVSGALAEVPSSVLGDSGDVVEVYVGDLTAATEVAELDRPGAGDDVDELREWLRPLTGLEGAPVFVPPLRLHEFETFGTESALDELGWSIVDVETFVEVNGGLSRFTVVRGDGIAPASGLAEGDGGVLSIGEGDDLSVDPSLRTAARPLGRPLRLRTDDDAIAVALTTDAALGWRTDEPTLADSPLFADAASALDDVEVVAAAVVQGAARPVAALAAGATDPDEVLELLGTPAIGAPYLITGLGWYAVEGEAAVRIVYVFTDQATAEAQLPVIEDLYRSGTSVVGGQPMSELVTVRAAAVDGRLVVVDVGLVDGRPPSSVLAMLLQGETIFLVR